MIVPGRLGHVLCAGLLVAITAVSLPSVARSRPQRGTRRVSTVKGPYRRAPQVSILPGPYRRTARFIVTESGHGTWTTSYHSRPPNPGGAPDDDTAHDVSQETWAERFRAPLTLGPCRDGLPCLPAQLSGTSGTSSGQGVIDHVHIDGLYRFDDMSGRCRVRDATPRGVRLDSSLTPTRRGGSVRMTVSDPVASLWATFPSGCPRRGDSIDGLNDSYYTPGFSFAPGWGYDRWFTPRPVTLTLASLHRARRVVIRLGPAPANTPPVNCAPADPSVQRCRTAGDWSGVLTLTRAP